MAGENTADIFQRQLAEKETELETLNVRYANLADELQISRNRQTEEVEDLTAKSEKAISQAEFYKTENIRLHDEVKQLTEAAIAEGGKFFDFRSNRVQKFFFDLFPKAEFS